MKTLHSLIHSLSKSEQKVVRTSLICFSSHRNLETKTLKLFEKVLQSPSQAPSSKDCCLVVYGKERDRRFKMLKSRLKSKLLDSMSLDFNLERKELFDAVDRKTIKIRKKLSQLFFIYFSRGNTGVLKSLLEEIIKVSKEYESYAPLVEALKFKKYTKGFCKGEAEFNEVNREIEFYEQCGRCVNKANDAYYRLILRTDFHAALNRDQLQEFLRRNIEELTAEQAHTGSSIVRYYIKLLEMAFFQNIEDYENARKSSVELLDIIMNCKSVYRKQRLGLVLINLCQFNIFSQQYDEAVKNAREALSYFKPDYVNYSVFREQEFYALFYSNRLEEATVVATELLNKSNREQGDFRLAKYRFYRANILFRQRNYKAVFSELNIPFEISKDKSGWDIAVRVLIIMTLMELQLFDEASMKIAGLKKHMERNTTPEETLQREELIIKILSSLERSGFDFYNISERIVLQIELLEDQSSAYRWKPLKPEIIPFHNWIKSKFRFKKERKPEAVSTLNAIH